MILFRRGPWLFWWSCSVYRGPWFDDLVPQMHIIEDRTAEKDSLHLSQLHYFQASMSASLLCKVAASCPSPPVVYRLRHRWSMVALSWGWWQWPAITNRVYIQGASLKPWSLIGRTESHLQRLHLAACSSMRHLSHLDYMYMVEHCVAISRGALNHYGGAYTLAQ